MSPGICFKIVPQSRHVFIDSEINKLASLPDLFFQDKQGLPHVELLTASYELILVIFGVYAA